MRRGITTKSPNKVPTDNDKMLDNFPNIVIWNIKTHLDLIKPPLSRQAKSAICAIFLVSFLGNISLSPKNTFFIHIFLLDPPMFINRTSPFNKVVRILWLCKKLRFRTVLRDLEELLHLWLRLCPALSTNEIIFVRNSSAVCLAMSLLWDARNKWVK